MAEQAERIEELREWCKAKRRQGIESHQWIVDQMEFLLGVIDSEREQLTTGLSNLARYLNEADLRESLAVLAVLEEGRLPKLDSAEAPRG